jgi:cob(I)alamin adenosyltransferase
MKSRVTTKQGDDGDARAISGDRLPKSHPLMECVGKVDALRADTARLRLELLESGREDAEELGAFMLWLLHVYFLAGTQCSDPERKHPEYWYDQVGERYLKRLEAEQARLEAGLTLPRSFIVTATNSLAAHADAVCTVVRDLERAAVGLREAVPAFQANELLVFFNRLSDYFFVLARHLEDGEHHPVDYNVLGLD